MDGLLVANPVNIRYLTGFSGSSALLLFTRRAARLVVDFRYRVQAQAEVRGCAVEELVGPREEFLSDFLSRHATGKVGFETSMPYWLYRKVKQWTRNARLTPAAGVVEELREAKDGGEVALITRCASIMARSLEALRGEMEAGWTERRTALALEWHLRNNGSDPVPFPIIVASGPNAAMPHARAGERVIGEGETVIIDFGAAVEGYAGDATRTVWLGRLPPNLANIYRVVYDAQRAGREAVRPGVSASVVDLAARGVIREAGFGKEFGHATGHGIGLEVHEAPTIAPGSEKPLARGMVVTVEPGIYVEGVGGVRIEDMVLLTASGHRVLTSAIPIPGPDVVDG